MRHWIELAAAFLGLASLAPAQRFGSTHQMFPAYSDDTAVVALGDVDADGDLDAFVGNLNEQDRLFLSDGMGVFADVTPTSLPAMLDFTTSVALGDVDGDGDLDALIGKVGSCGPMGCVGGQNRLYLNNGTGVFTDVTAASLPPIPSFTQAVALGDVDGDGDLDAFMGNSLGFTGAQDHLYRNGGGGVFTDVTATSLPVSLDNTRAVALGDVDGDGDLDAFVGNAGQNRLYFNGGTGIFTDVTATNLPGLIDSTQAVALGDVDGDGDLDAFVGNAGQNRLYLNAGTGVFTDVTATNLPGLLDDTRAVALGDVDADGDLDALVGDGALGGAQNRLYRNDGTGAFVGLTATNLPASLDDSRAVALGDVDGDGDLDALAGNGFGSGLGEQSRLYLNDGTGAFTDATATNLPGLIDDTHAVTLGDLDGDGDLDAFVGNDGLSRLYTNLTRQVVWRGIPRVGKPLVLDLRGSANGFWVLGASLATATIPFPPFGTLRLDPATLIVVGGGALDPQGRASVSFLVPAGPALVGATVYWQAGVGPPPLLTNLEITTLTNL